MTLFNLNRDATWTNSDGASLAWGNETGRNPLAVRVDGSVYKTHGFVKSNFAPVAVTEKRCIGVMMDSPVEETQPYTIKAYAADVDGNPYSFGFGWVDSVAGDNASVLEAQFYEIAPGMNADIFMIRPKAESDPLVNASLCFFISANGGNDVSRECVLSVQSLSYAPDLFSTAIF